MSAHREETTACPHEVEVLDLVAIGQWPARAGTALAAHVSTCPLCADLAAVSVAMSALNDASMSTVRVPDSALIWYHAQTRARADLARRAGRPLLVAQAAAATVLVGVVLVTWPSSSGWLSTWWGGVVDAAAPASVALDFDWAGTSLSASRWLVAGLAGSAMLIAAAFGVARLADRISEPSSRS